MAGLGDGGATQPVEGASYLGRIKGDPGEVLTQVDKEPARTWATPRKPPRAWPLAPVLRDPATWQATDLTERDLVVMAVGLAMFARLGWMRRGSWHLGKRRA